VKIADFNEEGIENGAGFPVVIDVLDDGFIMAVNVVGDLGMVDPGVTEDDLVTSVDAVWDITLIVPDVVVAFPSLPELVVELLHSVVVDVAQVFGAGPILASE
jgi:hypothetical protein